MNETERILGASWLGRQLHYYESIDSTNLEIKRLAEQDAPHGTVVLAEQQDEGRGRMGHQWVSPKRTGLWFSLLLRPDILPEQASMMTLVAAMAVEKAVEETQGVKAGIKWPNDIVLNGKKICGILTEMEIKDKKVDYIVVGIGINVLQKEFPEDLAETATSLKIELAPEEEEQYPEQISRTQLFQAVMWKFESYYECFMKAMDIRLFQDEYQSCLVNKDQTVKVMNPAGAYEGIARGVNQKGELLVERDGRILEINSGEVSVRGIYGYV